MISSRVLLTIALTVACSSEGWSQTASQSIPSAAAAVQQTAVEPQPEAKGGRTRREGRTPRPRRESTRVRRDSGPTRQELTLTAKVLGGHDDNLAANLGTGHGLVPAPMAAGSTGSADTAFAYFLGNAARSVRVDSNGNIRAYPGYVKDPSVGGAASVTGSTVAGRNLTLTASQRFVYSPFLYALPFAASNDSLARGTDGIVSATGLFERRMVISHTSVLADRRLSSQSRASISYSYEAQRYPAGDSGNNQLHYVKTHYRRSVTNEVAIGTTYRYVNGRYSGYYATARSTREHTLEVGPEIKTSLPGRRQLGLSFGAGVTYIESVRAVGGERDKSWLPTANGSAKLSLSPSFSIEGGYGRAFTILRGVTDEVYATDTGFLSAACLVATRTTVRVASTYSDSRTSMAGPINDTFKVYGASFQIDYALTRNITTTAGYLYYHHRYSNPAALPTRFPANYNRQSFNVGMTLTVPLLRTTSGRALPRR